MKGPPRCPVCRAWLTADRTIAEARDPHAVWHYLLACPGCLAVVELERPEQTRMARPPRIEIAGAMIFRLLERLRRGREGSAGAVLEETRVDPLLRLLLRVPEVFALTRPAYGKEVLLAEPAAFWALEPPGGEPGRVELRRVEPEDRWAGEVSEGISRVSLSAGSRLRVKDFEPTRFLLEGADREKGLFPWLEGLYAYPDLVRPADPW